MRKALFAISFALTFLSAAGGTQIWAQTQDQRPASPPRVQVQMTNGEIVLGDQKIPMTQGAAIPGPVSLAQKIQAALPAYLSAKFKGSAVIAVPVGQVSPAAGAKTVTKGPMPMAAMHALPAGFTKVLSGYEGHCIVCLSREIPVYTPLNENRLAGLQTFLVANTPAGWGAAPPQQVTLNPNNFLIDPVSASAFAGPLLPSPIACPPPVPAGTVSPTVQATCAPSSPLYVAGPIVSIVVPTHIEIMNSGTGSYDANELPLTQISVQVLSNPNSPVSDSSDPDGLQFTSNLAAAGVTAGAPTQPGAAAPAFQSQNGGQAVTLNVQQETWNPSSANPAWMLDFGLLNKYGVINGYAPFLMLAYPNPGSAGGVATDTVTFNLQLSRIVTVIRFNLTMQGPGYIEPASIVIPIVIEPAGTIQGKVQPVFIAYEPPGNAATFQYSTSQSGGVTVQSQYQVSSSQTQQNSSNQGFAWTPDLTGTIPGTGIKLGITGSFGSTSSTTSQDTGISTTTNATSMTNTWTATANLSGGWPQPPKSTPGSPPIPTQAPAVSTWQANTEYCGSGSVNLVQPSPPDGNAYLCQNDGVSGGAMPIFSALGATTDGQITWTNVGSAAIFQSPFWEDTIYLEPFPTYAVWDMPAPAGGGSLQVAPMPAADIPWGVTVLQLHLCYEGLYAPFDAAANLTLTPYDCASLLALDPFYLYGQHASLAQVNTSVGSTSGAATVAVPAQGSGIPPGSSSSTAIQKVEAASAVNTTQTLSSTATSVTSISGSNWSLGLNVSGTLYNGSASGGSGQQSGSSITSTFTSSTALTASVTSGISGTVAVSGNQASPASSEYVDARFGGVMFPSVNAAVMSITPQGCPGQEVFIDGAGLTGTTSITFNPVNAGSSTVAVTIPSFAVASDETVDVWLPAPGNPSSYATPPVGTYSVAIQGEGFGPITIPGQFQVTACSGT